MVRNHGKGYEPLIVGLSVIYRRIYRKKPESYMKSVQECAEAHANDPENLSPGDFKKRTLAGIKKFEA